MKKGYTLIEVMIAIAILGILAAIAIPVLHGHNTSQSLSQESTSTHCDKNHMVDSGPSSGN